jgi:hypothetical protein
VRTAESFNGDAAGAPLLHIEYTVSGNQAPLVDAGPNRTVTLPATAALDGSVSDDGEPNPPGALTTSWSQVSGPGTASFANPNAVDTTASFSAAGTYILRLTASDGQRIAFDEMTVTVFAAGGAALTLEVRVAATADDAEQGAGGAIDLSSSDLELVADGSDVQTVGMRFNGLTIPPSSTITSAYIQFKVDETNSGATSLTLQGQAADHAPVFTSASGSISARSRTNASVAWSPPAWPTVGAAGTDQRTPGIAAIIQEIVSRPGWVNGNSLVIIITGSGERTAESYDGDQAGAPLLHVEYNVP